MSLRYYTVKEANATLPELEPLVGRVLELRARLSHESRAIDALSVTPGSDLGGPLFSRLTVEVGEIEDLIERIQSYGCVLTVSYTHLTLPTSDLV